MLMSEDWVHMEWTLDEAKQLLAELHELEANNIMDPGPRVHHLMALLKELTTINE